jgi:hypothetical protein
MSFLASMCPGARQGLNQEDRELLRLEKSKPLLYQINPKIQAARADALQKRSG